ncbi:hypothetical protein X965_01270 [Morganella sp. EGD-HP17]|nr:hypothetical protein X965_01270 [Morganella sp. EGD-HP17]
MRLPAGQTPSYILSVKFFLFLPITDKSTALFHPALYRRKPAFLSAAAVTGVKDK